MKHFSELYKSLNNTILALLCAAVLLSLAACGKT